MKKKIVSLVALALLGTASVFADDESMNPIITAAPSLSIVPDARSGGMGDVGLATRPDVNSQFWNPAKYALMDGKGGAAISYTPWLRKIVKDIDLVYAAGYYNISDLGGAVSASLRYFSLGKVDLTDLNGTFLQEAHPNEWSADIGYSHKLHEYVSMGVAFRFIYSDLNNGANSSTTGGTEMYPGMAFGADVAVFYQQPFDLPMGKALLGVGFNLSNLGSKISYDKKVTSNFIPAKMALGVSWEQPFNEYNTLMISADASKLLVPTMKSKEYVTEDNPEGKMTQDEYSDITSVKGWFKSFGDAPGGFKEEMKEIQWGVGLEYAYNHQFFGRFGYSHEAKTKGNRRYFTVGAGFRLSMFQLDVAYVIAQAQTNPLDQTLRFTLAFNMDGMKNLWDKDK